MENLWNLGALLGVFVTDAYIIRKKGQRFIGVQ